MWSRSSNLPESARESQIIAAFDAIISCRFQGEDLPDDLAAARWPELMPELGRRLEELRWVEQARRQAASSSEAETFAGATVPTPGLEPIQRLAELLPGYEIHAALSQGGQGVVYRAVQKSTRRTVAIKVMREGPFAGVRDRARFEREVQVLARLKHPNIVTIHDSGVADGHFYFVMDFVAGQPLDQFIASRGFKVEQTLTLFADVCEAVHAAHLRGVIHRDLKPSNVLVVEEGSEFRVQGSGSTHRSTSLNPEPRTLNPRPRVLDFGLAKISGDEWNDDSARVTMTDAGQFVGSLPWASPEQAAGRADQIDVRTDVYSLGVMLFHSLTGVFPYALSENLHTMLGRILTAEPPRPSSQRRNLDDDVDTMVLKCLAKEPERRYQSAGELARDIRHYLAKEPIDAKRDNAWYVLRKALRRYRVAVAVAAAFVVLIAGSTVALWNLYRTSEGRAERARLEQTRAEVAEKDAQLKQNLAEIEAARAKDFQSFMQKLLSRSRPSEALGAEATVREFLDEAALRTESELATRPEVQGAILDTIGTTYGALTLYDKAEAALRRALDLRRGALGNKHPDAAATMYNLGHVLRQSGHYPESMELLNQAVATLNDAPTDQRRPLVGCYTELAQLARRREMLDEAENYAKRATALADNIESGSLEVAWCLDTYASVKKDRREFEEARAAYEAALRIQRARLPAMHPDIAATLNNLGSLLNDMGRHDEARGVLEEALGLRKKLLPPGHADWAATVNNIARVHAALGDDSAAEAGYREVIEVCRRTQGESHPFLAGALFNLAELLGLRGKPAAAESLYCEALALDRARVGDRSSQVGDDAFGLATVLFEQGRFADAEPYFREALTIAKTLGDKLTTSVRADRLATALQNLGRFDEGEALFREALTDCRALGPDAWRALTIRLNNLALLLKTRGALDEAEPLYREALELRRSKLDPDDPLVASSLANLGMLLLERRDFGMAEPMLRESLEIRRKKLGPDHPDTHLSMRGLASILAEVGRANDAEALYRECIQRATAGLPERQLQLWAAQVAYGRFLVKLRRFDEAEPLLKSSFAEMRERFSVEHAHVRKAIDGLVELYEGWDRPQEAETYRELIRSTASTPKP